jgi:hypothetical protein
MVPRAASPGAGAYSSPVHRGPLLHERPTCDVAYAQMAGIATIGVHIVPFYLAEPKIFSQLLTRANEAELKSQAGPAYRVVNKEKLARRGR